MSLVQSNSANRGKVSQRLQLWIDGVGGFLVLLADRAMIGQAMASSGVDIPLMGDVSRRHASIRRSGSDYIIDPLSEVKINGQTMIQPSLLKNNDEILLGRGVQMQLTRPHPLSSTAVLKLQSRHRTEPVSDAIVLFSDTMMLGPKKNNHLVCPKWTDEVVLFRQGDQILVKSKMPLYSSTSNKEVRSIKIGEAVQGEDISFCFESI